MPKDLDDLVVKLMAKSPADRPWDAAAVEQSFKDLRDKAQRGDAIAMVWPDPGSPAANPRRAGMGLPAAARAGRNPQVGHVGGFSWGFAIGDPEGVESSPACPSGGSSRPSDWSPP